MIQRPGSEEYAAFYAGYIGRVPGGANLMDLLAGQAGELRELLDSTSEAHASTRPAPKEWSIKEVVGHLCDTERVFAYRALRIARADQTPLAGFDQDEYVGATNFNNRPLAELIEEFRFQRQANVLCFKALTDSETARLGTASGNPVSVRAQLYMLAGHVIHHIVSLKTDYKIRG